MHRGMLTVLLLAVLACGDESEPFAPRIQEAPTASISGPLISNVVIDALPAVQDALDRLVPNLASEGASAALDDALRRLVSAIGGTNASEVDAALVVVRHEVDTYARISGDDPDVDAIRHALESLR